MTLQAVCDDVVQFPGYPGAFFGHGLSGLFLALLLELCRRPLQRGRVTVTLVEDPAEPPGNEKNTTEGTTSSVGRPDRTPGIAMQ